MRKIEVYLLYINSKLNYMKNFDFSFKPTVERKRTHKVHRNSKSQKRFGHRKCTTSNNKNKDVPINHGYHLEDYKRKVVYEHYYDDEKLPFYIGQGTIGRAFDFRKTRRNESYNEKAIDINLIKVNIVAIDISKEEAEALEEELIAKYKRKCDGGSLVNITKRTTGGFNPNLCIPVYQFDKDGNYIAKFNSIVEASRKTGINKTCISLCAKGYKAHSSAGGYKWRHTEEFTNIENSNKLNSNPIAKECRKKYNETYKAKIKEKKLNELLKLKLKMNFN